MPPWMIPLLGSVIGGGASIYSARQAQSFGERMSSTAHQREVRDLIAAGINPMVGAAGSGAATPSAAPADVSGGAEKGIASAMAIKQSAAQTALLEAQGAEVRQRVKLAGAQTAATEFGTRRGESLLPLDIAAARTAVNSGYLSYQQQGLMQPVLLERAKAELKSTLASAARVDALRALDEAALAGAKNLERFEQRIGEVGPWTRLFFDLLRRTR